MKEVLNAKQFITLFKRATTKLNASDIKDLENESNASDFSRSRVLNPSEFAPKGTLGSPKKNTGRSSPDSPDPT